MVSAIIANLWSKLQHERILSMNKIAWIWLGLSFLFFATAYAADPAAYVATVSVKSQTEDDRLLGFRAALSQVVNQVSGNRGMAYQLKVSGMTNLYPYIQRYYYQAASEETGEDEETLDNIVKKTQRLVVQFDPLSVDNLIKTASLPATPAVAVHLTPVLLWLSVNEKGKAWLLSDDGENPLAKQVKFMGKNKNLDIMVPMFDLDDVNALSVSEVDKMNISSISQASARYGSELILVGSVAGQDKDWKARWMLLKNGKRFAWDDHGVSLNGAVLSGLLKASDMVNNPNAIETANNKGRIILTVSGIENVTHYASVNAYLQNLNEVSSVSILRVEPSRIIFDVVLASDDRDGFVKSLAANPHFVAQPNVSTQELNYTWK